MTINHTLKMPFDKINSLFKYAFKRADSPSKALGFEQTLHKYFLDRQVKLFNKHKAKAQQKGQVLIVGAGPGDAELMTIKGLKALQNAEIFQI